MFDKFKNFIANLFLKIKSLFIKIKPYLKTIGLYLLCILSLIIFAFTSSDCKKTSAKTLDKNNVINGDTFSFNLGDITQYAFTLGADNTNNYCESVGSAPTYLKLTTSYVSPNEYRWYFNVGLGTYYTPFNDSMFNSFNYSNSNTDYGYTAYVPEVPNQARTSIQVSMNNVSPTIPITIWGYNKNIDYKFSNVNRIGFFYPTNMVFGTDNTVSGYSGFMKYNHDGTTYFLMGADINSALRELVAYNVSYINVPASQSQTIDGSSFYLTMNTFCVHTFLFNDNNVFCYGYGVPPRYRPLSATQFDNATYYLNEFEYTLDYEDGYRKGEEDGFNEGFTQGLNQGSQSGYNNGYDVGYNQGFNEGAQASLEELTPMNSIKTMVTSLLDIKLFGDVSLGIALSLGFGIILFGLIIKVFLGG